MIELNFYTIKCRFFSGLDSKENLDQAVTPEQLSLLVNIDQPELPKFSFKSSPGRSSSEDKKQPKPESTLNDISKAAVKVVSAPQPEAPVAEEEEDFPDFVDPGFDAFLTQDLPDDDLLGMLMAATEQEEEPSSQEDDPMQEVAVRPAKDSEHDPITDNLDSILDSLESDLPQMSCEDAEDVFNDVFLAEENLSVRTLSSQNGVAIAAVTTIASRMVSVSSTGADQIPGVTWISQSQESLGDAETHEGTEGPNNTVKTVLKWEQDEALGPMATISAVLYANVQHPDLIQKFPEFSERYKQISKLWRKVSTEDRQPFLQKARENRAATRASKAQKAKEEKVSKAFCSLI